MKKDIDDLRKGIKILYKLFGFKDTGNVFKDFTVGLGEVEEHGIGITIEDRFVKLVFDVYDQHKNGILDSEEILNVWTDVSYLKNKPVAREEAKKQLEKSGKVEWNFDDFSTYFQKVEQESTLYDDVNVSTTYEKDELRQKQKEILDCDLGVLLTTLTNNESTGNVFKDLSKLTSDFSNMVTYNILKFYFYLYDKDEKGYLNKEQIKKLSDDIKAMSHENMDQDELEGIEESYKEMLKNVNSSSGENVSLDQFVQAFQSVFQY